MAGTGYKTTGTAANVSGVGADWINPTNVQAQDANFSSCTISVGPDGNSDTLRCTNFDFSSLASTDTIIGFSVAIYGGMASAETGIKWNKATLWDGSATLGTDTSGEGVFFSSTRTLYTWGGPSNLWGAAAPSIATVQGSGWGVDLTIGSVSTGGVACEFDWVRMAVHTANTRNRRQIGARGRMR